MQRWMLSSVLLVGLALPAWAERKVAVDAPLLLKLPVGKLVVLVLPERTSSTTSPLPKERMQIGEDGPYVTFIVTDPTIEPNSVAVVDERSKLYYVRFEVVTKGGDDVVYVTQASPVKRAAFTATSFLRALRTGQALPDAQPREPLLPALADDRLALRDPQMVTVAGKQGLRVTLENTQDVPVALDIRVGAPAKVDAFTVALAQWVWPPRQTIRALAVEQDLLPPHGSTQLYVIYEER